MPDIAILFFGREISFLLTVLGPLLFCKPRADDMRI